MRPIPDPKKNFTEIFLRKFWVKIYGVAKWNVKLWEKNHLDSAIPTVQGVRALFNTPFPLRLQSSSYTS